MSSSEHGGLASLRGKEAKIVIQSLADPVNPTQIIDSKTTSNNKDGGAFHAIISGGGGGGNKCIFSVTDSTITTSST